MSLTNRSSGLPLGELPRVSVVVPFYNQQGFLREALNSVALQGYSNLEILVVDDGSSEGDLSWVADMGGQFRLLRQRNAGPAAARNLGIREATGDVIAFIDSDDLWPRDKLKKQILPFVVDQSVDVAMSKVVTLTKSEEQPEAYRCAGESFYTIQLGCMLVRKGIFDRVGLFDESLVYSEDQDWFLRAREIGIKIVRVDMDGLLYRKHEASLTRRHDIKPDYGLIHILKRSLDRRRNGGKGAPRSLLSLSELTVWEGGS